MIKISPQLAASDNFAVLKRFKVTCTQRIEHSKRETPEIIL